MIAKSQQQKSDPKPASAAKPEAEVRTREVKRYTAQCPFECEFNARTTKELHASKASAEVETVRHIRAGHADDLRAEVTALKQRRVTVEDVSVVLK